MNFQQLPKIEWPTSKDPKVWDRILDTLPEGSELLINEFGHVVGVEIRIVCMLEDDNHTNECDNTVID